MCQPLRLLRRSPVWAGLLALTLVLGACSTPRAGTGSETLAPETEAPPVEAQVPASTGAAGRESGGDTRGSRSSEASGDSRKRGRSTAAEESITEPQLGVYDYTISGTYQYGSESRQRYPSKARMVVEYVGKDEDPEESGPQFTTRTTWNFAQDTLVTTTQWEPGRVLLLYTNLLSDGEHRCVYEPPVEILRLPIQAQVLPAQPWEGAECSGEIQVSVLRKESVSAAGRRWEAWKVRQVMRYVMGDLEGTRDDTIWISPDLGVELKIERKADVTRSGDRLRMRQTMLLKEYPS